MWNDEDRDFIRGVFEEWSNSDDEKGRLLIKIEGHLASIADSLALIVNEKTTK